MYSRMVNIQMTTTSGVRFGRLSSVFITAVVISSFIDM